ncbi:MAG: signal peptidase II [Succinivibrionaceae bacterium]|nr:signal peptidase II [Ruminobacter sp.]MDY5778449.1 signal peptidase II [Succinivibrionaceae bacterium]MEE1339468.1 signal peptidase II [Succinivibrionaceae bacterium]
MTQEQKVRSGLWFLIVSVIAIIIDLFSKLWIVNNIEAYSLESSIEVISNFFRIVHVHNNGAAFSFLAEHSGWQKWMFASFAVFVSLVLMVLMHKTPAAKWFTNLSYSLIIGGAIGNLIDRVMYGYVIDFLDFYLVYDKAEHHYPAFNIADCVICVGVAMAIICQIFTPSKKN